MVEHTSSVVVNGREDGGSGNQDGELFVVVVTVFQEVTAFL